QTLFPTTVEAGTLSISSGDQLGSGNLTLNGGTLEGTANLTQPHTLVLTGSGGIIDTGAFTVTQQGIVSGPGGLTKSGTGKLILTNTLNGSQTLFPTTVEAGTLSISSGEQLGSGNLTLNGGTLEASADLTQPRTVVFGPNSGTIDTGTFTVTQQGIVSGPGRLTKIGTGTLILTNTLNGSQTLFPTDVQAGTLSISSGEQLGSGNLTLDGGTLEATAGLNQPRTLVIGTNGGTIDTGTFLFNQNGFFAGGGAFTKTGMGTLSLNEAESNTFSGTIDLQEGTLAVGSLGEGGAINLADGTAFEALSSLTNLNRDFTLNGTNTFLVSRGDTFTAGGTFTGPGMFLVKEGSGNLVFTNANAGYAGNVFVNNGSFRLDAGASMTTATFLVSDGSLLTGSGNFGATTNNGGRITGNGTYTSLTLSNGLIAPGDSIGVITVLTDYIQAAGSIYEVEINSRASDQILVTGMATISTGAVLRVLEPQGTAPKGTTFDILIASGGIDQLWSAQELIGETPFTLTLEENNTIARLVINATNILAGRNVGTGNPLRVRDYIDALDLSGDEDLFNVIELADKLDDASLRNALNQMHPALYGAYPLLNVDTTAFILDVAQKQLSVTELRRCAANEHGLRHSSNYLWIAPFGLFGNVGEIDELRGYKSSSGGFLVGIDRMLPQESILLGTFLGYDYSYLSWKESAGEANAQQLLAGIRGAFCLPGGLLNTSLLGGANIYDSKRNVRFTGVNRTATSDHVGGFITSDLGLVFNYFRFVELFGSCSYNYLHQGGYVESGADSLDLRLFARDDHYLRSELGGRLKTDFYPQEERWNVFVGGSWVHKRPLQTGSYLSKFRDFGDSNELLEVNTFNNSLSFISPEAGLEYLGDFLSFSLFYQGEFGQDYSLNQLGIK
ncbi:MAG: autotransporter domain-containing protein, partial [Chlamydiota bacterium]